MLINIQARYMYTSVSWFFACQGVRPFSPYQAVGVRILYIVARGRYAATDVYWAHAALSADDKADVVLVSDRCVRQS